MTATADQLRSDISNATWRVETWTTRRDEAAQQLEHALRDKERAEKALEELKKP